MCYLKRERETTCYSLHISVRNLRHVTAEFLRMKEKKSVFSARSKCFSDWRRNSVLQRITLLWLRGPITTYKRCDYYPIFHQMCSFQMKMWCVLIVNYQFRSKCVSPQRRRKRKPNQLTCQHILYTMCFNYFYFTKQFSSTCFTSHHTLVFFFFASFCRYFYTLRWIMLNYYVK